MQDSRKRWTLAALLALAAGGTAGWLWVVWVRAPASPPQAAAANYVGAKACASCHTREYQAWLDSHHRLAMQEAGDKTVLGNFDGAEFRYAGTASRFFRREGRFMVRTDGPDGRLADFEVKYTFGVWPLQQYLIGFPGGRYQTLGIAWDARAKSEGGQRWFHVYPNEKVDHRDPLHWTGLYQNWNLECAACHSTNLKKGYDAASNAYKTTFSEINIACEACHGPGSRHVEWAKKPRPWYASSAEADTGLLVLRSRWSEAWQFPQPGAKVAQPARRRRPDERVRGLPCPALDRRRERPARRAARGHASPRPARPAELLRRRAAARGGLRLGLVPADEDAPARRHLHGLPRCAHARVARRG
jgi:cytochrome c553